jgi:hypothetical protein
MGSWNKQASRNNNIQPNLKFINEEQSEKKVQFSVQNRYGIETMIQEVKDVKPPLK